MELNLKGRTAIVTGAGRGIGRAIAAALAAEGVNLGLFGRDIERCEKLAQELRAKHTAIRVAVIPLDLGTLSITKALANEFGPLGITVNAICPGSTDTGRWTELVNITARERGLSIEDAKKHLVGDVPMGRVVVPEDIAGITVFLASAQAAMITGVAINVDGGRTRGI